MESIKYGFCMHVYTLMLVERLHTNNKEGSGVEAGKSFKDTTLEEIIFPPK